MEYNRVLKEIPKGLTSKGILDRLSENFHVFEISEPRPKEKKTFSMFLDHKWIGLKLKNRPFYSELENIDSYLLTKYCLDPIFDIKDITKSEKIDFVGGIRGTSEIEKRCKEDSILGFALYPVEVNDIMTIADSGLIMPPKSTWFEPKPRSGIIVRLLDN